MGEVRLFNFWWDGIGYGGPDWFGDLRSSHEVFNQAFVQTFPKLLYTNPFTSYNGGLGIIALSRLDGTAETTWNDDMIRAGILAMADSVGISGDPSKLHISSASIGEIQNGASLQIPDTNVNPLATTDGVNAALKAATETSWYIYALGAVALALILSRR